MKQVMNEKNQVSFLMKRLSDGKEVIIPFNQFIQEIVRRLDGSDAINDEVVFDKQIMRISSLQLFNGKAFLKLSIAGGQGSVEIDNAHEVEAGVFQAQYNDTITLKPDQRLYKFLRWEGEHASEVKSIGEGLYTLHMNEVQKNLVAVFNKEANPPEAK